VVEEGGNVTVYSEVYEVHGEGNVTLHSDVRLWYGAKEMLPCTVMCV